MQSTPDCAILPQCSLWNAGIRLERVDVRESLPLWWLTFDLVHNASQPLLSSQIYLFQGTKRIVHKPSPSVHHSSIAIMTAALSAFAQKLNITSPKSLQSHTNRKHSMSTFPRIGGELQWSKNIQC